jgi:predicted O-methyltransferase YrrM
MSDSTTNFTTDWVKAHHDNWLRYLAEFAHKPRIRALEIGSWEGRSARWFCEHILLGEGATLDCVDPWKGFAEQEHRFDQNTAKFGSKIRKHQCDSFRWGAEANVRSLGAQYDFIYVDGSHEAEDVLRDLVLCWPLLRAGGVMICDDYIHCDPHLRRQPEVAIDGFFQCHVDWELLHKGSQFIVRKSGDLLPVVASVNAANVVKPIKTRVDWVDQPHIRSNRKPSKRGVLTSASSPYWLTLRLQLQACGEAGVDMAVADQGLLPWQVDWLVDHGATVLMMPGSTELQHEQANFDLAWDKPAICRTSPFEETIWIDADAIPLRHLDLMFDYLQDGAWISLENYVSELHARQLYLRLLHAIFGHIPAFYSQASRINSGVFGFRQGDQWIKDWGTWCDIILSNPTLKQVCDLHDQHALVAVLCDPQIVDRPKIQDDRSLNCPANGLAIKESSRRKQYPWNADNCLELLRTDHPQASVVHWLGRPKPLWNGAGEDSCVETK